MHQSSEIKLVLLHTRLSSYIVSCLREFKRQSNAQLFLYTWPNQSDAPFDLSAYEDLGSIANRYDHSNETILRQILKTRPTAVLVSGWKDKGYVWICRRLKAEGIPIISGCDTQWNSSLRQRIAAWTSDAYIQKFIDVLWVTGERQRYFANALGFSGDHCWDGYYACDWDAFAAPQKCDAQRQNVQHNNATYFLYVGRYAPEKGLDTLAAAYKNYCQQVENPWPLICAGSGDLKHTLIEAGAVDKGFTQPNDLPALMQNASAFVLPSRSEPWGVVVQEAAASGLPLILSDVCGAGVHLLRPYHNGFCFSAGSVAELAQSLKLMHSLSVQQRLDYGRASHELSKQYKPQRWAETLLRGVNLQKANQQQLVSAAQ